MSAIIECYLYYIVVIQLLYYRPRPFAGQIDTIPPPISQGQVTPLQVQELFYMFQSSAKMNGFNTICQTKKF